MAQWVYYEHKGVACTISFYLCSKCQNGAPGHTVTPFCAYCGEAMEQHPRPATAAEFKHLTDIGEKLLYLGGENK